MAEPRISEFEVTDNSFFEAVAEAEEAKASEPEEVEGDEAPEDAPGDDVGGADDGVQSDADEEDLDEDGDEDESEEEEEGEEEGEEDAEEEQPEEEREVKTFKATKTDGSQLDIDDDTTFKMKVDGKFKRISLRELQSKYNGEVKHDELLRRSSEKNKELSSEINRIKAEDEEIRDLTKSFMEGLTQGDLFHAMGIISELTGEGDVETTIKQAIEGISMALEDFGSLTPEQIQARADAYKRTSELRKREKKVTSAEEKEKVAQAKKEREELCSTYDVSEEEARAAYLALKEHNEKSENPKDFSLQDVIVTALEYEVMNGIREAAEKYKVVLEDSDLGLLIEQGRAKRIHNRSRLKEKDYLGLLSEHMEEETKTLSRKVGAKKAKTTPKSKRKKKKVKEITRPDDIWDLG